MQVILLSLMLLLVPTTRAARPIPKPQNASVAADAPSRICLDAAKNALGPKAAVLACGHLTGAAALEVVAALRLKKFRTNADGIPVSKFVVLRRAGSRWSAELTADNYPPRNSIGYIGIDFINDSDLHGRYRISLFDEGSHRSPGFTISVFYLSPTGRNEGIPVDISWNPSVRRFQEYDENRDPAGFQPENRNPKHIRTPCCSP